MAKYGRFKYSQALYGHSPPKWITVRNKDDLKNNTDYAFVNYSDLNRIESLIKELADILTKDNIQHNIITNVWEAQTEENINSNMPTKDKMDNILNNIKTLQELIYNNYLGLGGTSEWTVSIPETMNYLSIDGINKIESALYEMYYSFYGYGGL